MKRVLILQEYVPSYRVPFFRILKQRARGEGIELLVAGGRPSPRQRARGDQVFDSVDMRLFQREFQVLGRRVTLRGGMPPGTKPFDLIVLEQARRNLDLYLRLLVPRRLRRTRLALWGHGCDRTQFAARFDAELLKLLTRRADWFFGYTEQSVSSVAALPYIHSRSTVVQNSTDTRWHREVKASISESERSALRRGYEVSGPVALFLGGLDESKRLDVLLDAADKIARHVPGFTLLVAGDGSARELVHEAARGNRAIRPIGRIDGRKLVATMDIADVLLMPGRVGLVAVDALAAGIPTVTLASSRHAPEYSYLRQDQTVLSVAPDEQYPEAVISLLGDRARLQAMSGASWADGEDFGVEVMADNFLAGLRMALS